MDSVRPLSPVALRRCAWVLCALLVFLASRGVWPIVPVEGDDQGVMFGVEGMAASSPDLLARRYLFEIQPGSYAVLAGIVRLTGISAQSAFAMATIVGAVLFAAAGAWLLSAALSIPFVFALLAMLACQETITAACYLNTSALAGGVVLLSLVPFALRSPLPLLLVGGAGLGIAGWLRGDALLVSPAALALLAVRDGFSSKILRETAFAALVSLLVFIGLRESSGAPLSAAFATYRAVPVSPHALRPTRDAVLTLLSPALLLLAIAGTLWLALKRKWTELSLVAAGVIPTAIAYRETLVTTKYLYFTIPFALVPALALLRVLLADRRRGTVAIFALIATADAVAGLRVLPVEARRLSPSPTVAFATFAAGPRTLELGIGGGDVIPNEDGFRLRTGPLFASETWHREKLHQQARLAEIRAFLEASSSETLYFAGWLPEQLALRELFAAGFHPQRAADFTTWCRGTQVVELRFLGHIGSLYQPAGLAPAPVRGHDPLLIGSYGGKVPSTELADGRHWRVASTPALGLVTLFRRDADR